MAALTSEQLANPRRFVTKFGEVVKSTKDPRDKQKNNHIFDYTIEVTGDTAIATNKLDSWAMGLIKTKTGWLVNEPWLGAKTKTVEIPAAGAEKGPGLEKPLDRKNARAVVEAYVSAALAGRIDEAASLAKNAPADSKQIEGFSKQLNVQRLAMKSVYVNDPAKPVTALATSEVVKLTKKQPDGQRDGFLVLTLTMSEAGWFVTDIDFESEESADRELKKFLGANPKSIGVPPLTAPAATEK